MATKNQTPITEEELAKEIQKLQDGDYIIYIGIEVTVRFFQEQLQKVGIQAETNEIRGAINELYQNKIIAIIPASKENHLSDYIMTFKKPD